LYAEARIDVDGTLVATTGQCKAGKLPRTAPTTMVR
jgi:hypothetical protein